MKNIAIYREARHGRKITQVSSENHLYNMQEYTNQNSKLNPNINNENTLIYVKDGELVKKQFIRNGENVDLIAFFKDKELLIDKKARDDYKAHKTAQKAANPTKKIRTVLQSKNLKREFGIFLGGDKIIGNKEDFEAKIVKSTLAILQKKGLDERNLLSITVHYDELTPHAHINFVDYSFKHHTTSQEHNKIRYVDGLDKTELRKLNCDNFAGFQDIVAKEMSMSRGKVGSRAKHKEKAQHYAELSEINKNVGLLNRQITDAKNEVEKHKKIISEYSNRIEILKQKNRNLENDKNGFLDAFKFTTLQVDRFEENLQTLFAALGLDGIKNTIKTLKDDVKVEYSEMREKLKKSGIATQADYMQLKKHYEEVKKNYDLLLTKQLTRIVDNEKKNKQLNNLSNMSL